MESPGTTTRRACFMEDDGLASIAEMEAGFSGYNNNSNSNVNYYYYCHQNQGFLKRRNSLRNMSSSLSGVGSVCSPRSVVVGRFYDARFELEPPHSPHFLEACFLCKKPLGDNRDIFMYRGDTPFCSEECRQEQIDIDEAKEKNWNLKALRNKKEASSSSSSASPTKSQNYPFRTGTVAAA